MSRIREARHRQVDDEGIQPYIDLEVNGWKMIFPVTGPKAHLTVCEGSSGTGTPQDSREDGREMEMSFSWSTANQFVTCSRAGSGTIAAMEK